MAANDIHSSFQMLQRVKSGPLFRRTSMPRPLSDATEILDTDFESDFAEEEFGDESPRSVGSLGADSVTTASTPRDVATPESPGLSGFHFHFDDEKPVRGPVGPHLFRSSVDSVELKSTIVDFMLVKTPTKVAFDPASTLEPERKDTPLPNSATEQAPQTQFNSVNAAVSALDEAEVRSWSPPDVVRWMQNAGFDDSVVEKFFINDISGAILLELQAEDLKELDIQSFGKRHRLMNSIQHLRDSVMISAGNPQTHTLPSNSSPSRNQTPAPQATPSPCDSSTSSPNEGEKKNTSPRRHRRRRQYRQDQRHGKEVLTPADSVSIVAIEQLLPREHKCHKGEACSKWQKRQRALERLASDLCVDPATILDGRQENQKPVLTAKRLIPGQEPELTPSIVASSDVLGPGHSPNFRLSEEKLNEVQPRDPLESVRQYLTWQHLSESLPVDNLATPPEDKYPSPSSDSPDSIKTNASLAENLKILPRLTIPVTQSLAVAGNASGNRSAERTITPSYSRKKSYFPERGTGPAPASEQIQLTVQQDTSPADYLRSPGDFYRGFNELQRQTTPFSEADVPVTAIPCGPIAREESQSVPPNMRYGHDMRSRADPIVRPASTRTDNHRRHPSFNVSTIQILDRVDERHAEPAPIDCPEDLNRTPRRIPRMPNDVTHSGWMKKRKTTRLLRHEWEDHHFTLKGTRLAMYEDEGAAHRDSKALEYIDVDDYAVACSSLASSSKLTAAFKKTVLKRRDATQDDMAFAFSLIPGTNGASSADRKAFFMNSGKSHHFAVKTRDERINWMRELMLAKALKRGKESGDMVNINGNVF